MLNLKWLIPIVLVMLISAATVNGIDIVKDGRPVTAIIIPDQALRPTKLAAEELQTLIRLATGAMLKIYPESTKPVNFAGLIYVGPCKATFSAGVAKRNPPINWFTGRIVGSNLFLCGDDQVANKYMTSLENQMRYMHSGSAFAVYELFERKLNARWLWPGKLGTLIDQTPDLSINDIDFSGQPKFISSWFYTNLKSYTRHGWSSEAERLKYMKNTFLWLRRNRFNLANCIMPDHSYGDYWRRFGKTRPDLFNLLPNGKREPLPGDKTGHAISMCISNPNVIKQKIADWTNPKYNNWFKKKRPGLKYIVASENDTCGMCTCKNCRAWDAPDTRFALSPYWAKGQIPTVSTRFSMPGLRSPVDISPSLGDRYARYYLTLYNAAKKINPKVTLVGYIYANYSESPQTIKLNRHIQLASTYPEAYPPTSEGRKIFESRWSGWSGTGASLVFRPNMVNNGHNMPVSFVNWAYDSIRFTNQSGSLVGLMFDSLLGEWGVQGFSYYVIARLNVDPTTPLDKIYADYCSAFGPAAAKVAKYWRYWELVSNKVNVKAYHQFQQKNHIGFKKWLPIAPLIFTPQVMSKGRELLNAAKTVPGLTAIQHRRLEFLALGLQNAERTLATLEVWNSYLRKKSSANRIRFANSLHTLYDFRKQIESSGVSNVGNLYYREGSTWANKFLKFASAKAPVTDGIRFAQYPLGRLNAGTTGWLLANDNGKKYHVVEVGKTQALRLNPESGGHCYTTRKLFDTPAKDFSASLVMAYTDFDMQKNGVINRVLFHNQSYLWRGVEIGFMHCDGKVFAAYRDGSIWRTLDTELQSETFYQFNITVSKSGTQCELSVSVANGKLLASRQFKPHGIAKIDAITLMGSLLVESIAAGTPHEDNSPKK